MPDHAAHPRLSRPLGLLTALALVVAQLGSPPAAVADTGPPLTGAAVATITAPDAAAPDSADGGGGHGHRRRWCLGIAQPGERRDRG